MASPPITEASEIRRRGRQRLIGAIALVAILVVFVPMVLDSDPRPPRPEPSLAIPSKVNAPPLPAPTKAPAAPAPAAAESKPAPAPAAAETTPTSPKSAKVEAASAAPAKPAAAPPKAAVAAAPKLEGFAVQVGAFRDEAKLAQAREKLTAAKIVHYTERLEVKAGPLTRLRAGPFPTREAAESALATLKRAALDGKVVTLP
jgi:DedD protein